METIAENRHRELTKTLEQKHQLLSINKRLESGGGGAAAALNFDTLQGSEVPPKIRALIEDAKGLKVRVKKYKDQCGAHERTISSQQAQITKLTDKVSALEGALKKLEKDPETILTEMKNAASATAKVAAAEEKVKEMEHRLSVVMRSKEVELKKFRIAASGIVKEREALEAEIEAMRMSLEEKDKEARAAAIKIRQLKEKMKPKPRPVPKPLEGTADSTLLASMDTLPSLNNTQPLPPVVAEPAEPAVQLVINIPAVELHIDVRPPEQTHVMLCLIEGETPAPAEEPQDVPKDVVQAPAKVDLAELAELEEAAKKIQELTRRRREAAEGSEATPAADGAEAAAATSGEAAKEEKKAPAAPPTPTAGRAAESEKPKKRSQTSRGPLRHK